MNGHEMSDGQELWLFAGLQTHEATQQFAHLAAQLQATLNVIRHSPGTHLLLAPSRS